MGAAHLRRSVVDEVESPRLLYMTQWHLRAGLWRSRFNLFDFYCSGTNLHPMITLNPIMIQRVYRMCQWK